MKTTVTVSAITLQFGAAVVAGQLNLSASIAFETLPLIAANPKFKFSHFARDVEEASGYTISAKTVANCATLANQLQLKYGAKIGAYEGGHTVENVLHFADFMRSELTNTTYTAKLEDLIAFCKSEPSAADKRAKEEQARKDAADALAKAQADAAAKELTSESDAKLSAAEKEKADALAAAAKAEEKAKEAEAKAEADRVAKVEADKRAASIAESSRIQAEEERQARVKAETQAAEAEAARKQAESFAVRVGVKADGTPDIVVALNPSPEFLEAVSKELAKMAKAIRKQQSTAMGAALLKAA